MELKKIENKFIIFIPFCKAYKNFIMECLNSIENQNYYNYEVIFVNDGGNIHELNNFFSGKNNYTILDFKENNGPAFSKWKFIEYIQNNLDEYNVNDICIIVDGDDYLLENALNIINDTYNNSKCWCTFGDNTGKFSLQNIKYYNKNTDYSEIRNSDWFANHPRTMKLFLLLKMQINDFRFNNEWMQKCTDRIIIYKAFELSGKSKISYINEIIYYYREHDLNSYKTFKGNKKAILDYCNNSKKIEEITEDIHIVMCCWKRYQNLDQQFNMLNNQTVSKRIHFHLVNNNYNDRDTLENIIEQCKQKYKNIKVSVVHYHNEYYGYQRFIYIRDILLKNYLLDYVIIIDDDQIFRNDWVEKMWRLRKPKIYTGWYCKKWIDHWDYWSGSLINYNACKKNINSNINEIDYVGTGGCLIDVSLFNTRTSFWIVPNDLPENITIYNIEDLWLSFIAKYEFSYQLKCNCLPEYISINNLDKNSKEVSLFITLKTQKQLLLDYLVNKYIKPSVSVILTTYNVGDYIDQTLSSIINQTYKNLEIIVVDDCSTDKTEEIILNYSKKYKNIIYKKFHHRTCGGCCNTSNLGLENATGDYIIFVDGDDYIEKKMTEILVKSILKSDYDIVICDYYEDVNGRLQDAYHDKIYKSLLRNYNKDHVFLTSPAPWNKIYRRSFLQENNIKFISGDYFFEDNPWHWLNLVNTDKISVIPDKLIYHRKETEREQTTTKFRIVDNYNLTYFFTVFYNIREIIKKNPSYRKIFFKWIYEYRFFIKIMEHDSKLNTKIVRILSNFIKNKTIYTKDLSIIIPVYKVDNFAFLDKLTLTLSKYNNIEIIFINDNPNKNKELDTYYQEYNNVFLIENDKNIGAGRSRNRAIPIIEGKYSYFFDADDSININLFLQELNILKKNNYDILYFKYLVNNKKNNLLENNYNILKDDKKIFFKVAMYPWSFIVKSSVIHNNSIFFGVTNIHNDINYYLLCSHFANKQYFSQNYIYNYVRLENDQSLSNNKDRSNSIHSLYHTYLKLKEIKYPYLKDYKLFVDRIICWNLNIDNKNKEKILDFQKLYFINNDTKFYFYIRGHIRNSFNTDRLNNFVKLLKSHFPNIKFILQTWKKQECKNSESWRNINENNEIISRETIENYFEDEDITEECLIIDEDSIELVGTSDGNIGVGHSPKKGWKNMWYGIYKGLEHIDISSSNNIIVSFRFDFFDLSQSADIDEGKIIQFIKNNLDNKNIQFIKYKVPGTDNLYMGRYNNIKALIEKFHFELDGILNMNKKIVHQEYLVNDIAGALEHNTIRGGTQRKMPRQYRMFSTRHKKRAPHPMKMTKTLNKRFAA